VSIGFLSLADALVTSVCISTGGQGLTKKYERIASGCEGTALLLNPKGIDGPPFIKLSLYWRNLLYKKNRGRVKRYKKEVRQILQIETLFGIFWTYSGTFSPACR
jgi:hypothetical protein